MSLYGTMSTAVSGMNAQANRLSTVSDNIANVNTTGYKRASTSFSSLILPSGSGNYNSGSVDTSVRRAISQEGDISYTNSDTNLSISGAGFFIVKDASGASLLTRDGSFLKDQSGNLVNSAGYTLMGYSYNSGEPAVVVNGFSGLVPINLSGGGLSSVPSTGGIFDVNLPANGKEVTPYMSHAPSDNKVPAYYDRKFTVASSDPVEDFYADVYMTKIGNNQWEVTAFGRHGAQSSGFPYDVSDPSPMATTTLTFDPATGAIVSGNPTLTISSLNDPFTIDLSGMTQAVGPATNNMGAHTNLPSDVPEIDTAAGELPPSSNDPASIYFAKQTWNGLSDAGSPIKIDAYYTKTGPDTWEASFFNAATATAGGFPYRPPQALATATLTFDAATGALVSPASITVPTSTTGGFDIDLTGMTSLPSNDPRVADQSGGMSLSFNLSPSTGVFERSLIGQTPAQNQVNSTYTNKTSLVAYDKLGNTVQLDIYYSKGPDDYWEMTVFNHADASLGGFPYGNAGSPPLATELLRFDSEGKLAADSPTSISFNLPGGEPMTLDLSGTSQLAAGFTTIEAHVNGHGASAVTGYNIASDGIVSLKYADGSFDPVYRIPLANVASPDNLTALTGNAFAVSNTSGVTITGFANTGGLGSIKARSLENSNVDLASELTEMIQAQKSYTANSKVFQTGSNLLDVLVNLQR